MRRREGLKGALRGNGFGPCIEAVILSEDAGLMSVEDDIEEEEGISRYAEPEAEGTMAVCKSGAMLASVQATMLLHVPDDGRELQLQPSGKNIEAIVALHKLSVRLTDPAKLIWPSCSCRSQNLKILRLSQRPSKDRRMCASAGRVVSSPIRVRCHCVL